MNENKILLSAFLILIVSMLSFNFSNKITGKITAEELEESIKEFERGTETTKREAQNIKEETTGIFDNLNNIKCSLPLLNRLLDCPEEEQETQGTFITTVSPDGIMSSIKALDSNNIFISFNPVGDGSYTTYNLKLAKSTDGGQTWTTIDTGINGFNSKIEVIDSSILFMSYRTYINQITNFNLAKSTDGGQTWTTIFTQSNSLGTFFALDSDILFTGYHNADYTAIGSSVKFMKSTDGGQTWTTIDTGIKNTFLRSIEALDLNNIFMVFEIGEVGFAKSTDGGQTWTQPVSIASYLYGAAGGYSSLFVLDSNNLFVNYNTGGAGSINYLKLAKSTDGGQTWTLSSIDNYVDPYYSTPIHAIDSNNIYIFYENENNGLRLAKSTDGGQTWTSTGIDIGEHYELRYRAMNVYGNKIFLSYTKSSELKFAKQTR